MQLEKSLPSLLAVQDCRKLGMVAPACNPSTKKVKVKGSEVRGQLQFYSEFKTNRNLRGTVPGHAQVLRGKVEELVVMQTLHRKKNLHLSLSPSYKY